MEPWSALLWREEREKEKDKENEKECLTLTTRSLGALSLPHTYNSSNNSGINSSINSTMRLPWSLTSYEQPCRRASHLEVLSQYVPKAGAHVIASCLLSFVSGIVQGSSK